MKQISLHKYTYALFVMVNSLFIWLLNNYCHIRFEENDDVVMLLISSGSYSGTPGSHLVFINVIYGWFISKLYILWSSIEWYTLTFAIIHILSVSVIGTFIVKSKNKTLSKIIFLLLLYAFEIRVITLLQFTTSAAIAALAGIVLIKNSKKLLNYFGVILFILASLIRFEAAFLVLLIISPVFLKASLENKKIVFERSLIIVVSCILISIVFKAIDHEIYKNNSEWKNYKEFNVIRGKINDNPNAIKVFNKLPVNISETDFDLFMLFLPDPSIFDTKSLRIISSEIEHVSLVSKFGNILPQILKYKVWLILIALWVVVLFFALSGSQRKIVVLVCSIFLAALCLVTLNGSLKYRVFISAFLPFVYLFPLFSQNITIRNQLKFIRVISFIIILYFTKQNVYILNNNKDFFHNTYNEQIQLINNYLSDKSKKLILFAADFRIELGKPFNCSANYHENQMFFGGWATNIPYNKDRFDSFKCFINGYGLFLHKQNLKIILPLIQKSINRNHNTTVIPNIILETGNFAIVEFCSKSNYKFWVCPKVT